MVKIFPLTLAPPNPPNPESNISINTLVAKNTIKAQTVGATDTLQPDKSASVTNTDKASPRKLILTATDACRVRPKFNYPSSQQLSVTADRPSSNDMGLAVTSVLMTTLSRIQSKNIIKNAKNAMLK